MAKTIIIVQPQSKPFDISKGEISHPNQQLEEVIPGVTVIELLAERLKQVNPDWVVFFAISEAPSWDAVADKAKTVEGIQVERISDWNRLANFINIAMENGADNIVRITGDNVWNDAACIRAMVEKLETEQLDLVDNFRGENGYPEGFNLDVVSTEALHRFESEFDKKETAIPFDKLHVVVGIREFTNPTHAKMYHVNPFKVGYYDLPNQTYDVAKTPALSCASPAQLKVHQQIYQTFQEQGIHPTTATFDQVMTAVGTPAVAYDKAEGLTTPASTKRGGTTDALIASNAAARYPLLLALEVRLAQPELI